MTSFLERRLLYNTLPTTKPVEAVSTSSQTPETQKQTPEKTPAPEITAEQQEQLKKIAELLQQNKPPAEPKNPEVKPEAKSEVKPNDKIAIWKGLSELIPNDENGGNRKITKMLVETLLSLGFAPYLVYNLTRFFIGATLKTATAETTKNVIGGVSKGVWERIGNVLWTVWNNGISKPVQGVLNSSLATLHAGYNIPRGSISGIIGGVQYALLGVSSVVKAPVNALNWVSEKTGLTSVPIIGSIIKGTSSKLNAWKQFVSNSARQSLGHAGKNFWNALTDVKFVASSTSSLLTRTALTPVNLTSGFIVGKETNKKTTELTEDMVRYVRDNSTIGYLLHKLPTSKPLVSINKPDYSPQLKAV